MNTYFNRAAATVALTATLCFSGCAVMKGEKSLKDSLPFAKQDKEEQEAYPTPQKMAVTWTPDIILRTGATPTRGFGGRIFFYDEKTRPVPVEGELAVQAIRTLPGEEPELKRYAFTPEQFTKHYSNSDLGASYSIWIPWDAAGGEETKITLVPSFKTKAGRLLQGTSSVVNLPGKSERDDTAFDLPPIDATASGPYNGGAWSLGNVNRSPRGGLTTTTIPVRGGLGRGPQVSPRQPLPGALSAEDLLARLQQASGNQPSANAPVQAAVANTTGEPPAAGVTTASAVAPVAKPTREAPRPAFQLPRHPNDRTNR